MSARTNPGLSRRGFLSSIALATGAVAASSALSAPAARASSAPAYEFYGPHQAGIAQDPQAHLSFAAVHLNVTTRTELRTLLQEWTSAAAAMTRGLPIGRATTGLERAPIDTGEALDLPPAGLTVTLGFGPSLFRDGSGRDRFGIAGAQPGALTVLPAFKGDALDPRRIGGDLCIQACADDAQVAAHAVRNLLRIAGKRIRPAWSQLGHNRSAALAAVPTTARNDFGFRDGTANIPGTDTAAMDRFVWAQPADGSAWMAGGSYLAVRRIRMLTQVWDDAVLREQEQVFGRRKSDGAPLSEGATAGNEFSRPDFARVNSDGKPMIPPHSHMALAHPSANDGVRIKRRAFNYADGDDATGAPDLGLFFMSYQRDLVRQYIPMQRRLAESDLLNEYIRHTASASFAVPPGAKGPGDYVGSTLLG